MFFLRRWGGGGHHLYIYNTYNTQYFILCSNYGRNCVFAHAARVTSAYGGGGWLICFSAKNTWKTIEKAHTTTTRRPHRTQVVCVHYNNNNKNSNNNNYITLPGKLRAVASSYTHTLTSVAMMMRCGSAAMLLRVDDDNDKTRAFRGCSASNVYVPLVSHHTTTTTTWRPKGTYCMCAVG